MGFLKSAINQVGRDMGRVVSNQVFKDAHSIPIRRARSRSTASENAQVQERRAAPIKEVADEFEKSISFKTGYRPTTLISKLGGAFTVIKNEAKAFVDDGYLDPEESAQLFTMLKQFNDKISDVEDVLSFTVDESAKEYKQLEKIVEALKEVFHDVLSVSIKACYERAKELEQMASEQKVVNQGRYIGLHVIWMPRYANGGEKKTTRAVIANILDILTCTWPITRLVLLIKGLTGYAAYQKEQDQSAQYRKMADLERQRAQAYEEFLEDNGV